MSNMTLKDKVKEVEPDKIDDERFIVGIEGCPYEYDCLEGHYIEVDCGRMTCEECWSQEYIEKDVTDSNVNHPEHYQGKNECIDVMIAMFGKEAVKHFCMCNAYKYRFRSNMKNGEEDIKKAEWYEDKLIELGGVDNDI